MKFRGSYLIVPLIVFATAVIGSMVTGPETAWYQSLALPSWTPPGVLISFAWMSIYLLTAVSVIITWNKVEHSEDFLPFFWAFILNALFNASWSILFFQKQMVFGALIDAMLIVASLVFLMIFSWRQSKLATYLLIPYLLWSIFATFLNYTIWQLNPQYALTFF